MSADELERVKATARLADEHAQQRVRELEDKVVALDDRLGEWREVADQAHAANAAMRAVVSGCGRCSARIGITPSSLGSDPFPPAAATCDVCQHPERTDVVAVLTPMDRPSPAVTVRLCEGCTEGLLNALTDVWRDAIARNNAEVQALMDMLGIDRVVPPAGPEDAR